MRSLLAIRNILLVKNTRKTQNIGILYFFYSIAIMRLMCHTHCEARPDTRLSDASPPSCPYSPFPSSLFLLHPLPCPLRHFLSLRLAIPNPWRSRQSKRRVFAHSKKNELRTDGRTDRPSYRDARTHLKTEFVIKL